MNDNIYNIIKEFGDNFAIQDKSLLIKDVKYYFSKINDTNIYQGTFHKIDLCNQFLFQDVKIFKDNMFVDYTNIMNTPFIDKIYYL